MSYQSGSSETGSLYLVPKPQKIDIPIGVYVNTEIDANRAVSLDFQWLQSDTFITTITECTGISDGEYYLAWVGRSNNSHPMGMSIFCGFGTRYKLPVSLEPD